MENKVILKIRNLNKKFNNNVVLNNITFDIFKGETLGIVGPSGCGKSTFGKILLLLLYPESGEIIYEEENIFNSAEPVLKKEHIDVPANDKTLQMTKDYTFDNFVIGSSNRVAQAACYAVATNPVISINPLFLYGPSGLGKAHLMFDTINEVKLQKPSTNIIYVTGEQFTNELIDALAQKRNMAFRDKYRNVDMLLVDDIQFIAGKYSVQEEFFHTFDALYKMQKQIILTSDRPPKDINYLEERLVSRFEMGLIADIQPPDTELRAAIFKLKTQAVGLSIPNDVLSFLAENIKSNIRQIEGAIKKLWAQSFITNEKITLEMAENVLKDYFKENEKQNITPDTIFAFITKRYGIAKEEIVGKKRHAELVYVRHIAIYLTSELTDLSLKKIGKQFNRDHATIISAKNNVQTRMKDDAAFNKDIQEIINELTSER
ncbi:MAG: chromosomal replication initiator protein DnaA [Clostridia bacterium]